jgi:TonB family protein
MNLIDILLARTGHGDDGRKRVLARVLLDDTGRVQAVKLKRSCGDPEVDAKALAELDNMHYSAPRLGSKSSRRWHDVAWTSGE